MKQRVPVVTSFCWRTADNRYEVEFGEPMSYFEPTIPRRRRWSQGTALLTAKIEEAVRRDITQWFWVHRRWRRTEMSAAPLPHRPRRAGDPAQHRQHRPALRRHRQRPAPGGQARLLPRRPLPEARRARLLAGGRRPPLAALDDLFAAFPGARFWYATKKRPALLCRRPTSAPATFWSSARRPAACPTSCSPPTPSGPSASRSSSPTVRSLNLSTAAGIVLYEALRQSGRLE